jgi:hypothetical protein
VTDARSAGAGLSDADLEKALRDLIDPTLSMVDRGASRYESTHPIERVSVSTKKGQLDLVCKYSQAHVDRLTGHSRGAAYEGAIYERVFPDPNLATPRYFGTFRVDESVSCLVLEHVSGYRVHHSVYPRALVEVCRDLARFHSSGVRGLNPNHNVFDRDLFTRLVSEVELLPEISPVLRESSSVLVDVLSNSPRTTIHGELYPQNVLINDTGPTVIDWEGAGVGPGVFDLAVLTQGSWDPELIAACEETYWREWGDAAPAWKSQNLAAARIMAAGLLLLHLRGKETDGIQEKIAIETIGAQVGRMSG